MDPESPVRYYPGRWTSARLQTGLFVARRSQAYGSDLWCYVQMRDGIPERLVDLPLGDSRWDGWDEAWHLQMAIDARRGKAQQFRVVSGLEGTSDMHFFSPVPIWAQRRWDAIGEQVSVPVVVFSHTD